MQIPRLTEHEVAAFLSADEMADAAARYGERIDYEGAADLIAWELAVGGAENLEPPSLAYWRAELLELRRRLSPSPPRPFRHPSLRG